MTAPDPAISTCASAAQRSRNIASCTTRSCFGLFVVEHDREDERATKPAKATNAEIALRVVPRARSTATTAGARRDRAATARGEREPVDVRLDDHLRLGRQAVNRTLSPASSVHVCESRVPPPNERVPEIRFGHAREPDQAERRAARRRRARRRAGRAPRPAPPGRRPGAARPRSRAACTSPPARSPTAPTTAQTQPCWNTPARIRNSPANDRRERDGERDDPRPS